MIRLTEYSHGAGCGCKISPALLNEILATSIPGMKDPNVLIGNDTRDDAAVYDLGNGEVIISTTDFFMPIVDDPKDFGGIAAVNAISDIYAMGGSPMMAIAILGWPINILEASVASLVLEGAREACARAGIIIAGGHSIDAPEPIFGLAVTGRAYKEHIKANAKAVEGANLYLTKPLGVGIIATAQKKGLVRKEDLNVARAQMLSLNKAGAEFATLEGVVAMTDVTGFGLMGHLIEMCEGSGLSAEIYTSKLPVIEHLDVYLQQNCIPGGTIRNFKSYGHKISPMNERQKAILCDPQTSGGLLVAVRPEEEPQFLQLARDFGLSLNPIGYLKEDAETIVTVSE